jgi:hypothetical protein
MARRLRHVPKMPSLSHGVASPVVVARPLPDMKTEPNREHGRPLPTLAAVGASSGEDDAADAQHLQ